MRALQLGGNLVPPWLGTWASLSTTWLQFPYLCSRGTLTWPQFPCLCSAASPMPMSCWAVWWNQKDVGVMEHRGGLGMPMGWEELMPGLLRLSP